MSFSGFMDTTGQLIGKLGPLGTIAIFGIPIAIISIILVSGVKGLYSLFGKISNPAGGSSVKKFRKKIGMCCFIFGLAIAIPLASLVKKYI